MLEWTEISGASKAQFYEELDRHLAALLDHERDFWANTANTAALLFHTLEEVNWAGFYVCRGGELVLGPFQGKPACVRIALGNGVCGSAAERRQTLVVADVGRFPGHISCDIVTRSEIAIPMVKGARLVGVLDLDSPRLERFDEEDRRGLERLVARLLASSNLPD